jgi:hypothetical protein
VIDSGNAFWANRQVFSYPMLDTSGGVVRHDSQKLARLIDYAISE